MIRILLGVMVLLLAAGAADMLAQNSNDRKRVAAA